MRKKSDGENSTLWMEEMNLGVSQHRSTLVKSSTGKYCGTKQKVSILSNAEDYTAIKTARDTLSRSRKYEGHTGMPPTDIWYNALRSQPHTTDSSPYSNIAPINSTVSRFLAKTHE